MTTEHPVPAVAGPPVAGKDVSTATGTGGLYLAFRLASDVYAIDILRIREIIEYSPPTAVPMMPPALRGVINLRGAVVPVIDLSVRFGRAATGVGKRTCFVIVEVEYGGVMLTLGLMVDGVNAVMEIDGDQVEPPPAFGAGIEINFISGMARANDRFIILLDVARVLSINEIAAISSVAERE